MRNKAELAAWGIIGVLSTATGTLISIPAFKALINHGGFSPECLVVPTIAGIGLIAFTIAKKACIR